MNSGTVRKNTETEKVLAQIDDTESRLTAQMTCIEERLNLLEKNQNLAEKAVNTIGAIGHKEMTPDQYMASKTPKTGIKFAGPVPLTEDGRCIDPSWHREGDFMIQRDLTSNQLLQKVAILT